MSHPLYVAFIWHQHQPLYKGLDSSNSDSQQYRLPWVRLHGTKDYLDLVLLLERYPKLHQTVNLVPSLILQLEDYIAGTAFDPYLTACLTPDEKITRTSPRRPRHTHTHLNKRSDRQVYVTLQPPHTHARGEEGFHLEIAMQIARTHTLIRTRSPLHAIPPSLESGSTHPGNKGLSVQ